jgi:pyruvate/2-oxoglutarate dehydrogenase complex dihydrolipoamide acyltransferase (E2) component
LQRNATATARALHEAADALDAYAHKLETAHHHHFFSLHKLMAVAAVVTITAVAVVVTMGAAAAAEAALAATAAGEATAAAGAAAAASTGAASGLLESTAGLIGIRALLSFVVPHLVQAELSAGFAATMDESVDGRLNWQDIETSAAAGFAGSASAASAARVAQSVKFAKETWPLLNALMPHLGQAAAWAGVDASQQEMSGGRVSLRELLLTAGMAGAGSALGARSIPVAKAYFGRQTAEQMLTEGVDLEAHEGADLGHTLAKHVNVTDADLMKRIVLEGRAESSRFIDRVTAEAAITRALRRAAESLRRFEFDGARAIRVRVTLDDPVGWVMNRNGELTATSQLVVWLRKDADGIYISSSYPELPR